MIRYLFLFLVMCSVVGCNDKKDRFINVPGLFVSGKVQYEKADINESRATLTGSTTPTSVSFARVEIIDAFSGEVLIGGNTGPDGSYQLDIPKQYELASLRVRVWAKSGDTQQPFSVTRHDNSNVDPGQIYSVISSSFIGRNTGFNITIKQSEVAGAFNIFQTIGEGFRFVENHADAERFPNLEIHWVSGEDGRDCTCYLNRFFASARTINLRGLTDAEEFDDSVILHELGHYMQEVFGDDDSPGGPHSISCTENQALDPRLAFSEGWATAFGQIVLGKSNYIDTNPNGFGGIIEIELPCSVQQGPYSEVVVAAVIWDLFDGSSNRVPSRDSDTFVLTFRQIWVVMRNSDGFAVDLNTFYQTLLDHNLIDSLQWNNNFLQLGVDEAALLAIP